MPTLNPALRQATLDYCPTLARVEAAALARLPRPPNLAAAEALLGNTPLHGNIVESAALLIAMNVLNYQFWARDADGGFTRYAHQGLVGAQGMMHAFTSTWLRHRPAMPMAPAGVIATVTRQFRKDLEHPGLLALFGDLPNSDSRLALLDEVLDAPRLTNAATYLAARLETENELGWGDAQLLAYLFPRGYADPYLKKAQLTLMFLGAEWREKYPRQPLRLDVSAAADYQLPKVLRALGLLAYGPALAEKVEQGQLIPADSAEERAIRAATLFACEALAVHFEAGIETVDFWLWQQRNTARDARFHLTQTTAY